MESLAPPVVAVVVAHDPGPWFEETLASLASQDYGEFSVLVLDVGSGGDMPARVAAILPTAYVRHCPERRGFGETVNQVRSMVDGAAYFLICHDDVALDPDAVHLLVEEAFRSNAGVVSPKMVSWDDPELLVHVGMNVDKGGSVVERVQPHEIDHGQHDAVRDVFVAPGGCTLIRADLFEELHGFDPTIVAMGEDLDLCWRAQVVGARIIVAPDARVRHLEMLASGSRPLERSLLQPPVEVAVPSDDGAAPPATAVQTITAEVLTEPDSDTTSAEPEPRHPVTLQELQRRHELLAVLTCYSWGHLLRVLPQVFLLAVGEIVVAEVAGNRARARAVARAWRWNLSRLAATRARRKILQANRRVGDKQIRLLQVRGSARVSAFARRVFQHGFHGAHADEMAAAAEVADAAGTMAPGDESIEVEADVEQSEAGRIGGGARLVVWLMAALLVIIGSRGVLTSQLPALGQFAPFPSWSATLSQFFTGWHPSGVGTTAPAAPALGIAALVGAVLLGAMGLAQKVLIFGCLPLGAWGAVRLLRPFGSQRAAMVAGLAYLAMALPYNALALGRLDALIVYAGAPWVLAALVRSTGLDPFVRRVEAPLPPSAASSEENVPSGAWASRHGLLGGALALGVLEAILISFAPAAGLVVLLVALAILVSSLVFRDAGSTGRAVRLALGSTAVAMIICLPWVIGVLSAGTGALEVFGVPTATSGAASWSSLLRFSVGPIGGSYLAWGFVIAAAAPLALARGVRFRWAVRFWAIALAAWVLAWLSGRGWTGGLSVDPLILLAPAAAATAASIGLGVAAFERDLRKAEFGWRQVATVVGVLAAGLASLPTLVSALPGRWELPVNDFSQSVAWMHAKAADGAFRVLWLGDPRSLNLGGWSAGDGLAYATSEDGAPDARWLWNATSPGPAGSLGSAVNLARADRTDRFGALVAPAGVRYVAVLTSVAPDITGEQSPTAYPVPNDLLPALGRQLDLQPVLSGTGITVYANADWVPMRAEVPAPVGATAASSAVADPVALDPGAPVVPGAVAVLPGVAAARSYTGPLGIGTVYASVAPSGSWKLVDGTGSAAARSSSFGWAAKYAVTAKGTGTLRFSGGFLPLVIGVFSLVVWGLAAAALVDRRRIRREWERVGRPRSWSHGRNGTGDLLDDVWASEDEGVR